MLTLAVTVVLLSLLSLDAQTTKVSQFTVMYGFDRQRVSKLYIRISAGCLQTIWSGEINPVMGSRFKVCMASIRMQCFMITACRNSVACWACKSRLEALSVLTVCRETLVPQNPTLMAFCMRPYICGVKALEEGMPARGSPRVFISGFCRKGLLSRGFPDWDGGPFYGPERSELYESGSGPFRPAAPSWNIMFVYLQREFILLIHWLALPQRPKEFDFAFIYSLHFFRPWKTGLVCVIPRENFLPPRRGPLWNEIIEGGEETRDRGQKT